MLLRRSWREAEGVLNPGSLLSALIEEEPGWLSRLYRTGASAIVPKRCLGAQRHCISVLLHGDVTD